MFETTTFNHQYYRASITRLDTITYQNDSDQKKRLRKLFFSVLDGYNVPPSQFQIQGEIGYRVPFYSQDGSPDAAAQVRVLIIFFLFFLYSTNIYLWID